MTTNYAIDVWPGFIRAECKGRFGAVLTLDARQDPDLAVLLDLNDDDLDRVRSSFLNLTDWQIKAYVANNLGEFDAAPVIRRHKTGSAI